MNPSGLHKGALMTAQIQLLFEPGHISHLCASPKLLLLFTTVGLSVQYSFKKTLNRVLHGFGNGTQNHKTTSQ